ncbi:MAG: amidohydrolase family protein [Actinomycetaceae bacterium]|nr:amidohydrolase family protein [Actinomycetaceae bacterium]
MLIRACALWAQSAEEDHRWVEGLFQVRDGRIYRVEETGAEVPTHRGWMIPGLVDVHCHIGYSQSGPVDEAGMRAQAQANFRAAVTAVRDCGSPVDNRAVAADSPIQILRAGRHIARPKRYIRSLAVEVEETELVDEVIRQAHQGSGWVKLVGDWIDRRDGSQSDLRPLWSAPALVDAVSAAHELGAKVAVHTFAHDTIDALLEAGVDSIEHGSGMDRDQVAQAAALGIAITPTLMQVGLFPEFATAAGSKYPVYAATMTNLSAGHEDVWESFVESGVQLLPGTDAGGYQKHGSLSAELALWEKAGLPAREILDAATWKARHFLGLAGLYEGAVADFALYDRDPRADLSALKAPALVVAGNHTSASGK